MAIIKLGTEIVEIRGRLGGNIYRKDNNGQCLQGAPRLVKKASPSQREQRKAFRRARKFCKTNECIKYNIYRALNTLPLQWPI